MATKKQQTVDYSNAPKDLKDHPFFGIVVDDPQQQEFRDAIWDQRYDIVFCNARAGTGKTLLAVATAALMVQYGLYDEVIYVTAAGVQQYKLGYLPGSMEQKISPMLAPLYQAVSRIGLNPERVIKTDTNLLFQKDGGAFISAMSDSYIRGINIGDADKKVVFILDESANFGKDELKTAITRVNDGSKTIVIGHDKQCDLKYKQDSGFVPFLEHFRKKDWCKICEFTKNYRGRVSAWADEL